MRKGFTGWAVASVRQPLLIPTIPANDAKQIAQMVTLRTRRIK
jgi:hypothetical protein